MIDLFPTGIVSAHVLSDLPWIRGIQHVLEDFLAQEIEAKDTDQVDPGRLVPDGNGTTLSSATNVFAGAMAIR